MVKTVKLNQEQLSYIRDMAPKFSYKSIANALGVSLTIVAYKANAFGIYKTARLSEPITRKKIKLLLEEGKTTDEIATFLKISKSSLNRYLCYQKISIRDLNIEIMKDLINLGLKKHQIIEKLQISEVTFYNRLKKIKNNKLIA